MTRGQLRLAAAFGVIIVALVGLVIVAFGAVVVIGGLASIDAGGTDTVATPTATPTATATPIATPSPTATPTVTATSTPTATATPLGDEQLRVLFRTVVSDYVYSVDSMTRTGDILILEYTSTASSEDEVAREIGGVAGAYAEAVNQSWSIERLEAGIYARDGDAAGDFYIKRDWAVAYNEGEITLEEYSRRVAETLQAYD
jgi:hypothetical protein